MSALVLQAAGQSIVACPPPDPESDIRVDLTHHTIVTIDDASTTEVDDGLSVETLPDGRRRLWVHVADPSRWVQPGSRLDLEARRRASTMYLPSGTLPVLNSQACSVSTSQHHSDSIAPAFIDAGLS